MRPYTRKSSSGFALALFGLTFAVILIAVLSRVQQQDSLFVFAEAAAMPDNSNHQNWPMFFNMAKQFVSSSMEANNQAQVYNSFMPNEDPRTAEILRESVDRTSHLISDYQHDGLANMPPFPNVPFLNVVTHGPDKIMRMELSALQDLIRMTEDMRDRPLTAIMNLPKGK